MSPIGRKHTYLFTVHALKVAKLGVPTSVDAGIRRLQPLGKFPRQSLVHGDGRSSEVTTAIF